VDSNDLRATLVGVIQVNASTLSTDDEWRNQAIWNRILHTDQYEFVTFTPTQIIGFSGSAVPGQLISFQIAGDLMIQDITLPAVFDVSVTGETSQRLAGAAMTLIQR
jgi:polyisoprenoid-binding protein YceI